MTDTYIKYKYGLLYDPKGNRLYLEKPADQSKPVTVTPTQVGTLSRRNLEHMPK